MSCGPLSHLPNGIAVFNLKIPDPPDVWLLGSPPTNHARACIGQSAPGNYWLVLADAPDQPNTMRCLASFQPSELGAPLDTLPDYPDRLPVVKGALPSFWFWV